MNTVKQTEALHSLIRTLEENQKNELILLKSQLRLAGQSLKPANLIKSVSNELTESKNLKAYLIQAGIGLVISLLTKKIVDSARAAKSSNLVGNIAEMGLNGLTANQAALIKTMAPLAIGLIAEVISNKRKKSKKKIKATE